MLSRTGCKKLRRRYAKSSSRRSARQMMSCSPNTWRVSLLARKRCAMAWRWALEAAQSCPFWRGPPSRISASTCFLRGKTQDPTPEVGAGDIGAVAKLAETLPGDTLTTRERPLILPPPVFPPTVFSVAVSPKTKADLDKMSAALARLVEEDPTLE